VGAGGGSPREGSVVDPRWPTSTGSGPRTPRMPRP